MKEVNKKETKKTKKQNSIYEDDTVEIKPTFKEKNPTEQLKVLAYIIIAILCIDTILIGYIAVKGVKPSATTSDPVVEEDYADYDVSMFTTITGEELLTKVNNKETFFLFTGRANCPYCVNFLPVLQHSVSHYNYTLYYLDIRTVNEDTAQKIMAISTEFSEYFGRTPIVFYLSKGVYKNMSVGSVDEATYETFLVNNGVKER